MLSGSRNSNGSPSEDNSRRQLIKVSSPQDVSIQEEEDVDDLSLSSGDKRKREGKQRSRVWKHFTKLIKEDGSCEKCKCNHCLRLFTCSSRSGTTHLLRHITEGICPSYNNKDNTPYPYLKYHQSSSHDQHVFDVLNQTSHAFDDSNSIPIHPITPKSPLLGDSFINEFRTCATKLVHLTNQIPHIPTTPDYSLATALNFLNLFLDIPQSTDMYLDAFEILKDPVERECFICLSPEPRRRWLQRMLHRRYPARYSYDTTH